ncbi:MAG TPA: hypothetical protein VMP86_04745 [Candidatus Binatia bacterium]|nr:hypothetical protein [Candidatus Binatia bacterium]
MTLAFATGAVASAVSAAGLTALLVWIATLVTGSSAPWSIAPWLVPTVAAVVAVATYLAERIAYGRTLARRRAAGEPWAYRA